MTNSIKTIVVQAGIAVFGSGATEAEAKQDAIQYLDYQVSTVAEKLEMLEQDLAKYSNYQEAAMFGGMWMGDCSDMLADAIESGNGECFHYDSLEGFVHESELEDEDYSVSLDDEDLDDDLDDELYDAE